MIGMIAVPALTALALFAAAWLHCGAYDERPTLRLLAALVGTSALIVVLQVALALMGLLRPKPLFVLSWVVAAAGTGVWMYRGGRFRAAFPAIARPTLLGAVLGVLTALAYGAVLFVGVLVPPYGWDSLVYHLTDVFQFAQKGTLEVFGFPGRNLYYPQVGELHSLFAYLLSGAGPDSYRLTGIALLPLRAHRGDRGAGGSRVAWLPERRGLDRSRRDARADRDDPAARRVRGRGVRRVRPRRVRLRAGGGRGRAFRARRLLRHRGRTGARRQALLSLLCPSRDRRPGNLERGPRDRHRRFPGASSKARAVRNPLCGRMRLLARTEPAPNRKPALPAPRRGGGSHDPRRSEGDQPIEAAAGVVRFRDRLVDPVPVLRDVSGETRLFARERLRTAVRRRLRRLGPRSLPGGAAPRRAPFSGVSSPCRSLSSCISR